MAASSATLQRDDGVALPADGLGYLWVGDLAVAESVHLELTPSVRELLTAVTSPAFLVEAAAAMGQDATELERLLGELLRTVQRQNDVPGFGLCKSCRFHQQRDGEPFCGLTQEPLGRPSIELICREHMPRDEAA